MRPISWKTYLARIDRAKRATRGRRIQVEIEFSRRDLVDIARQGYDITAKGLRRFVQEQAVKNELNWIRPADGSVAEADGRETPSSGVRRMSARAAVPEEMCNAKPQVDF